MFIFTPIYLLILCVCICEFQFKVKCSFDSFIISIVIIIIHCCCRTVITVFINYVEIMEERQNFNIQVGKMNNNSNVRNIYI